MRRIYITLAVLLFGMIGMAYLYFSNLNTETEANDLSLNTIASNSSIVFSFENDKGFYEILTGQDLLQNLLGELKTAQFKTLRANLADDKGMSDALAGQKVYVGFLAGQDNGIDYLISTQLNSKAEPLKLIGGLNKKAKVNKTEFGYEVVFADSTVCYLGIQDKLVIISNSARTVGQILTGKKSIDEHFVSYIKTKNKFSKNTLATLYVDFSKLPPLLANILNTNLTGELAVLKNQKSYAALNYNFSNEKLLFNGSTELNDLDNYYALFAKIPEQKISIPNILPEKTASFTTYGIDDYKTWSDGLKKLQAIQQESLKLQQNISRINEKYRVDLGEIFSKYFKNELMTFQLNTGEKFGALKLDNGEKVNQLLLDLSEEYSTGIRIFKESGIPFTFFGEPFKNFERPFYAIIDNNLVMANNASSIQSFLNSYANNKLLINQEDYINFSNQLSASSTIAFYVNNANSNDIFGRNLKTPYYKQYQSKQGFKNYFAVSYQLSGENGKFLTNMILYKKPEKLVALDSLTKN